LQVSLHLDHFSIFVCLQTGITIDIIDCDARKVVHVINDESITTANHGSVRKVTNQSVSLLLPYASAPAERWLTFPLTFL
jgi:hypothetical protein